MYSTTVSTLQTALHSKMQVTSTADLQTRQRMFLKRELQLLRGGTAALAVASGAAAVSYALQALAKAGDNIVAAKTIYGGTYNWLEHTFSEYGVTTKFVDPDEENAFENAIDENTKAVFIESLGNPNSNIIDIEEVANIAHSHKIPLVIDSTFATPYLLRPFEYGADNRCSFGNKVYRRSRYGSRRCNR